MNGKIWVKSEKNIGSSFIFEVFLVNEHLEIETKKIVESKSENIIDFDLENKIISELKEKLKTNQPKIINPYLDKISKYNFSKNTQIAISLAKDYKIKEALKVLDIFK